MFRRKIFPKAINKITVIGAATAFALAFRNAANEIVLVDINGGEAMDVYQAIPHV